MSNSGNIYTLLNHMKWADAEVWKKVLAFESAENDEKIKKLIISSSSSAICVLLFVE